MRWFNRLRCRFVGHRFKTFAEGFKRQCKCCGREEWVMGRPYPRIGQPKYYWKHMDFEGLERRRK